MTSTESGRTAIPLVSEHAEIHKRLIETGRVRIAKTISEREAVLSEPLLADEVTVTRVTIDRVVDSDVLPQTRREGDVLIVPVLEEVLVVEKRIVLKEELHIACAQRTEQVEERVVVRSEHVDVQRIEGSHQAVQANPRDKGRAAAPRVQRQPRRFQPTTKE